MEKGDLQLDPKVASRALARGAMRSKSITPAGLEQLLHPRIEEMSVAVLCHPAGPRQVAVMDDFGAIRFSRRVQSEDDEDDFTPVGAFGVGIKEPEIGHEVPLVVGVNARCFGLSLIHISARNPGDP